MITEGSYVLNRSYFGLHFHPKLPIQPNHRQLIKKKVHCIVHPNLVLEMDIHVLQSCIKIGNCHLTMEEEEVPLQNLEFRENSNLPSTKAESK